MTPFSVFILIDALFLALLVCSLIWLFKTSRSAIWLKVTLALALCVLACWSPLATRAILGYPQPRALNELPDRFQLLAEHTADDQSFDLWIEASEPAPLSVTVVPDKQMRGLLRSAERKLREGVPVIFRREASNGERGDGHGHAASNEGAAGKTDGANPGKNGAARTNFDDDQTRWTLDASVDKWRKDGSDKPETD
jgi:hypothetical protein